MTDKFKYNSSGQEEAIAYLILIGATSNVIDSDGHIDPTNAVTWANHQYSILNPEPPKNLMNIYEIHGEETPSKEELGRELRQKYGDITEEELKRLINDAMYGGIDDNRTGE